MGKDIFGFLKRKIKEQEIVKEEMKNNGSRQEELKLNMLLLAHSLEKGLSLEHIRKGFGLEKAKRLLGNLELYLSNGYDCNEFAFIEAFCLLKAYFEFSVSNDCDVEELVFKFNKIENQVKCEYIPAGVKVLDSMAEMYKGIDASAIKYFMESRHSIRSYKTEKVTDEVMKDVISLARCAPSACNRQPSKIYWTSDHMQVEKINKLIPGNKGFEDAIPNWGIITTSRELFNKNERFQWYVNGGIFVAYFVEALHAHCIGSCIFQIPVAHENATEIKKIAGIPESEAIIAAVGFGYSKQSVNVLSASRRPVKEILFKF